MPRTPPWLQSILEEHFEELQMLWELRQSSVRDPDYDRSDVAELDERIEAHTDGLVLSEAHSTALLEEGLASDEPSMVFAAAYVLLRLDGKGPAQQVIKALRQAEEEGVLAGIGDALCYGPIKQVCADLRELVISAAPPVACVAAEALAYHQQLDPQAQRWEEFFASDDPRLRQAAWRISTLTAS